MKTKIFNAVCKTRYLALLVVLIFTCGNAWGDSAVFTPTGSSSGTLTGAPTGATATFSNSGSGANQMTSGKGQTLTLSGFDGCTVTGVTVHVRCNKSSGAGSGSLTINGSSAGSLSSQSGLGNTYVDKNFTVTSTLVGTGKTIVVTLTASSNSFWCDKYTITYTAPTPVGPSVTPDPTSLSWGTVLQGSSQSAKTISITGANLTAGDLTISATGGYSVTPTSKSVSGTLSATTLTVTPPSTSTTGAKNGKVSITGGGLAAAVEINLSMTVNAAYPVHYYVNGGEITELKEIVASGGTVSSLPTEDDIDNCDADGHPYFVGWSTSNFGTRNTAPTTLVDGTEIINEEKHYYAVFAAGTGGSPTEIFSDNMNISGTSGVSSRSGWDNFAYAYGGNGSIRLSSGSNAGRMRKTAMGSLTSPATLTFKILHYGSENGQVSLSASKGTFSTTSFTASSGSNTWQEVSTTLTGGDNTTTITFNGTSGKRIYIKDISITSGGGIEYTEWITKCCDSWTPPTLSYSVPGDWKNGDSNINATLGSGTTYGGTTWTSSDESVLTVNSSGQIHAVGAGTATVTVTWAGDGSHCSQSRTSATITVNGNVAVSFNANGGSLGTTSQSVPYNTATNLTTFANLSGTAPNCKRFDHWNTANDNSGTSYTDGQSVTLTAGLTLYAIYSDITYAVSDGTMVGVASHSYSANPITCGATLTITCAADGDHKGNPTVTATGTHGTITVVSATSVTIANVTSAIAVSISYAEKTNVTATWNVNNGSVTGGGTTTQKEGTTFTFPNVTSTDCGTFLGWTNAANSSYSSTSGKPTPFYSVGSTIVLNANTQFYAVYSKVGDDAVAGTLYQYNNDGTDLDDDTHGVTPSKSVTNKNSAPWIGFESVGNYIIWDLGGTPTSFSAYLVSSTGGTGSGQSTMVLEQGDKDGGVYTWDATPIATRSTSSASTEISMNITDASKFEKSHLRLRMSEKRMNIRMGAVTINGLIATITYTTNPGCVDWVLDAISVTTAPTKTTYDECEEFDPAGMVVTATMKENGNPSNTTTKDVAGYTWTPEQFLTPGNSIPVTITYTEKAVTKTTTYNVRVNDLPNYTITFHDGDGTTTWTQSNHCDACNLDSRTGSLACGDYTFAGWSSSSTSYDDQSATITTWVTGSYVPTANTDLYAVYRKGATPPAFTANCEGGTFYIYEANGNTHMAGRVNATPRAYTSEYWNNDGGTGCVACLDDGPDLTPFTFTKIAENTYKIQNSAGEYLRKYSSGNHPDFESTWYNEDNFKWVISAGTNGTWRFTNKNATDYALVKSGSYFDFQLASNVTPSSSYYDLELEPAASTVYQSNPNCASTYTITFNTHGGTFVQGNYAYATETTSGLSGTTSSKFPSATLSGCTFAGWREGSAQDEVTSNAAEADLSDVPYGLYAADADLSVSSNKTYHAVYHYYDEDLEFDPVNGGTYHMYATVSGTKHFCSGTPGTSYGVLTSTTDCNDVVDVVITPGTGANVGKYKINIGGYDVSPELNGTGLKRGTFWWNIAEVSDNLYHITADGAESGRSLNYYSTSSAFTHYKDNGAGNTKDISFGRCRQHHWTSEPVLVPMVVLNSNSNIMVTSTNGQTLRSTTMLTVTATHYGETTKIYLSANVAGVGFLKSDGTALSSDAGGSYLQTDAEGELATSVYVTYAPTVTTDGIENVTITARDGHSPSPLSQTTRSAQVRHLPTKFIIAQKVGDDWYALPNDMGNDYTSSTAAVKLSSVNESTGVATFYSDVTDQFAYQLLASKGLDKKGMVFSSPVKSNNIIKANTTSSTSTIGLYAQSGWTGANVQYYEFTPATTDLVDYTIKNTFQNNYLGITTGAWGIGSTNNVRFFSIDQKPAATITWQNDMLEAVHATNKAENGVVTLPTGANPLSCNDPSGLLTFDGWVTATWSGYKTTGFTKVVGGEPATSDVTYYAVFKDANNRYYTQCPTIYSITYKANGGTGSDYVVYTMNTTADAVAVATAGFTKEGSTFVGWTNPANAEGTIITPGAGKITGLSGDITLNAVWIGTTTVTGTVRLTASAGEKVATSGTEVSINSTDFACATALRITYKDVTNDVTYGRSGTPSYTSSEFRLCNGSYGSADGTNISLAEVSGAYNQTYSITYEPNGGANTLDHYQLKIEVLLKNTVIETKTLELYGRTLPASFAIATKIGGAWYALPNNMSSEGTYDPILISVTEDANILNWTAQGPSTAAYKMKDYTVNYSRLRFAANDANQYCLWAANGDAAGIRNWSASSTDANYGWIVAETNADFSGYTMATSNNTRTGLMISNNKWGMANSGYSEIHFIPLTTVETIDIIAREWKTNGLVFAIAADNNVSLTSGHTQYGIDAAPTTNVTSITRHSTGGYGLYEVGLTDITGDYGKVLSLKMKIGGVDKIANVTIPIIVSGTDVTTAASEPFTTLDAATKDYDVVILEGAKLTTNATASHASKFHNLYVYAGGTLINDNGSTSVNYLEMRGGIKGVAHKEDLAQGVPHLRLNKQISSTNGANLDMYVNTAHSYALSVPFEVSLSGVNYANSLNTSTGAAINGTLDSQFRIMRYDGETRSTGASGWTPITSTSYTLQVGQGYVLQGKRPKGQPFAVIRFPFTGVASWANASGEGGTTGKPAIDIYAHEGGANTPDNDKGWNLIANPYMATISYYGDEEEAYAADFTVGCLEKTNTTPWDGKYSYTETTDAYVTMPNDWYSAFPQYRANSAQAVFEPFKNFFIQTSADGSVLFDRSKRASAPRHLLAQTENVSPIYADINLTHGDDFAQAGLKIDANATTGYKFGEDQNIFENREALTYLKVYTVADGHYLVGNTLTPAETAELIPLEFYAPNINGEYVFSLDANSDIDRLEYVILYDAELGLNTNLLTNDYTVELEQTGLIENRFSIGLKVKEKDNSATGIDDVGGDSERPYKFLYRDKMYILRGGKIYDATGKQVREIK